MPNIRKPASFATWSPEKQQAWMDQMEELQRQQAEIAAETAAANKKRAIPGTERRRPRQPSQRPPSTNINRNPNRPTPASPRPGPSVPGTIRIIKDREQMLQGLKGGGPVKKKVVAKKAMAKGVAKKATAKGVAKRGMGRAMMRGR